eukprot:TRINITY_DN8642_c0_g1_i1.p1 TRINITY_DN8642_c0_g1~~TRINITY_DN8642_c0_g1_i1.p1  ORF type:complete len:912 (-),score=239.35 TRINITY_DN8642_c0_g1_i1:26-2761(-)
MLRLINRTKRRHKISRSPKLVTRSIADPARRWPDYEHLKKDQIVGGTTDPLTLTSENDLLKITEKQQNIIFGNDKQFKEKVDTLIEELNYSKEGMYEKMGEEKKDFMLHAMARYHAIKDGKLPTNYDGPLQLDQDGDPEIPNKVDAEINRHGMPFVPSVEDQMLSMNISEDDPNFSWVNVAAMDQYEADMTMELPPSYQTTVAQSLFETEKKVFKWKKYKNGPKQQQVLDLILEKMEINLKALKYSIVVESLNQLLVLGCKPSSIYFQHAMYALLQLGFLADIDKVWWYMIDAKIKPTEVCLQAAIYSQLFQFQEANVSSLYRFSVTNNIKLNIKTKNQILYYSKKFENWRMFNEWWDIIQEDGDADLETYILILNHHVEKGAWDDFEKIKEEVENSGVLGPQEPFKFNKEDIEPFVMPDGIKGEIDIHKYNVISYYLILARSSAKHNDWEEMDKYLKLVHEDLDLDNKPLPDEDAVTFITCYSDNGQWKLAEPYVEVLLNHRIQLNQEFLDHIIVLIAKHGEYKKVLEIAEEYQLLGINASRFYRTALMIVYFNLGEYNRVRNEFVKITDLGFTPDHEAGRIMIQTYVITKDVPAAVRFLDRWISSEEGILPEDIYDSYLEICLKNLRNPMLAYTVINNVVDKYEQKISEKSLTDVLVALAGDDRPETVNNMVEKFIGEDKMYPMTGKALSAFIWGNKENSKKVADIWEEHSFVPQTPESAEAIITVFGEHHYYELAIEVYEKVKRSYNKNEIICASKALLNIFSRKPEYMAKAYELMDLVPEIWEVFVLTFIQTGDVEMAFRLYREIAEKKIGYKLDIHVAQVFFKFMEKVDQGAQKQYWSKLFNKVSTLTGPSDQKVLGTGDSIYIQRALLKVDPSKIKAVIPDALLGLAYEPYTYKSNIGSLYGINK